MRRSHHHQLPLTPLDKDAVQDLVVSLLGNDHSLSGLAERIVKWTGGNPFFTEEVINELIEAAQLAGERGAYRLTTDIERLEVPTNVRAVLAARIDRLPDAAKQLLQSASVIGKSFSGPVLETIQEAPISEWSKYLDVLKESDFIYESALYPIVEYAFKHPLTHEVAYNSQLAGRRAQAHAAVARAIELNDRDMLDERAALLAYHWDSAGDLEQAVRWHDRAAAWVGFKDARAATRHWARVRELVRELPASQDIAALGARACVHLLNYAWMVGHSSEQAAAVFDEGKALAEVTGNVALQSQLTGAYSMARGTLGDMSDFLMYISTAVELAEQAGGGNEAGMAIRIGLVTRVWWPFSGMYYAQRIGAREYARRSALRRRRGRSEHRAVVAVDAGPVPGHARPLRGRASPVR